MTNTVAVLRLEGTRWSVAYSIHTYVRCLNRAWNLKHSFEALMVEGDLSNLDLGHNTSSCTLGAISHEYRRGTVHRQTSLITSCPIVIIIYELQLVSHYRLAIKVTTGLADWRVVAMLPYSLNDGR